MNHNNQSPKQAHFYTWRKCSTCRDAKNTLDSLGIQVHERDFFNNTLSRDEITALVAQIGIDNLFSWRSPSAKTLRERKDSVSQDELIDAMLHEPRLIRRPILIPPDAKPIIGHNKTEYAKLKQT